MEDWLPYVDLCAQVAPRAMRRGNPAGERGSAGPRGGSSAAEADALAVEGLRELADVAAEIGSAVVLELFPLVDGGLVLRVLRRGGGGDPRPGRSPRRRAGGRHLASPGGALETLAQLRENALRAPRCTSTTAANRRARARPDLPGDGTVDVAGWAPWSATGRGTATSRRWIGSWASAAG